MGSYEYLLEPDLTKTQKQILKCVKPKLPKTATKILKEFKNINYSDNSDIFARDERELKVRLNVEEKIKKFNEEMLRKMNDTSPLIGLYFNKLSESYFNKTFDKLLFKYKIPQLKKYYLRGRSKGRPDFKEVNYLDMERFLWSKVKNIPVKQKRNIYTRGRYIFESNITSKNKEKRIKEYNNAVSEFESIYPYFANNIQESVKILYPKGIFEHFDIRK